MPLSEADRSKLLEVAVQAIAWALIENDTDTSDRGVTKEHYDARIADARRLLPMVVAEPPVCICYSTLDSRCMAHEPVESPWEPTQESAEQVHGDTP